MFKLTVVILFTFSTTLLYAQGSGPVWGIPNLAIQSNTTPTSLALPPLQIETNQLITDAANCPCATGCTVLPVKMLSFEGRRMNTALVQLEWETANETDNKGFEVERSLGNSKDFLFIGFVPAQMPGALLHEYKLPDNNDFAGTSFYRLKQIDINGQSTYSKTIAVKGYSSNPSLSLFPNPVADKVTADIFSTGSGKAVLTVTDAAQKIIFTQTITLTKGINLIQLPAAKLSRAVYFIQLLSEHMKPLSAKFVKL